ncbi:hypothetical protein P171DRAFT_492034 [Karstenula rhodostoma CBS 690.94]|uniref:Secreted protein n=1 Tax=Karstenula rhodostoma CBS 690.94 TaxID=1392251 RepID=A0A9P4U665_9PLEO|nr:hypothetical protein P171DRAFT_492034 [Karstenula rhodostoma CBS 690.94]
MATSQQQATATRSLTLIILVLSDLPQSPRSGIEPPPNSPVLAAMHVVQASEKLQRVMLGPSVVPEFASMSSPAGTMPR